MNKRCMRGKVKIVGEHTLSVENIRGVIGALKHNNSSVLNDVILDITLDLKDHCSVKESELNFKKPVNEDKLGNSSNIFPTKQLSGNCSSGSSVLGYFPELKRIMIEEKTEQKTLFRFSGSTGETRKLSHLSQKQKKILVAANKEQGNWLGPPMLSHPLPDTGGQCTKLAISCPWEKLDTQKSHTMSFWDTNDEEKISTFHNISSSVNQSSAPLSPWIKNGTKGPNDVTFFASLKAIQQAEEEK